MSAEMVNTKEVMSQSVSMTKIDSFMAKQEVQAKLAALGVSSETMKQRMASLSDDEIAQINQKIDTMPAGGDAGVIIGVLAFIFIVLLITDLFGITKVFNFSKTM